MTTVGGGDGGDAEAVEEEEDGDVMAASDGAGDVESTQGHY